MNLVQKVLLLSVVSVVIISCEDKEDNDDSSQPVVAWSKVIYSDWGNCISPTSDGGFVAFCTSSWDGISAELYRISASGEIVDSISLPTSCTDRHYGCCKTANGGMWIVFQSNGINLQRFDSELELVQSIVVAPHDWKVMEIVDTHVGLMVACQIQDSVNVSRCALLTMDYQGNVQFVDTLSVPVIAQDSVSVSDNIYHMAVSSRGDVFLTGGRYFETYWGSIFSTYGLVVKASNDGPIEWYWVLDATLRDYTTSILPLANGGAIAYVDTFRSERNQFVEFSPDGVQTSREDLSSWFEDWSVYGFIKSPYGASYAICGRSFFEGVGAENLVVSLDEIGQPISRMTIQNGMGVSASAWLSDGSLGLLGWYPSDVFPQPSAIAKIQF
ncbi:MAG: hypothetical protein IPP40_13190 [bacterium]|nr:hypothetical protein [bacterium]